MQRLLLSLFLVVFFVFSPLSVSAQSEITIEKMQVRIWPEYDEPSVLVINNIFLAGDVKLPVRLNFFIPVHAGAPHSVAVRELDGQLYLLEYEMETVGEWNQLTFTSPYPEIWIEYYDPAITKEEALRSFEFNWVGEYSINDLQIEVQRPLTATAMSFKESMGSPQVGNDGLTYYFSNVGELKANTSVSLHVEYTKTDEILSSSVAAPVQPVTPLNIDEGVDNTSFVQILPFIVAGIGLVMLIFGVFWYLNKNKETATKPRQRHTPAKRSSQMEEDSIFCHRCGRRADEGDVFCRACGTKLKLEE